MKSVDRIDMNKRRAIPVNIKLVILFAVIFGIWMRSCWIKNQAFTLRLYNIEVTEVTPTSIEVHFDVSNPNDIEIKKYVLIKAFTPQNELIASRITEIISMPKSKKRFLKMLNTLIIPVRELDDIGNVTVEIYTPTIFD